MRLAGRQGVSLIETLIVTGLTAVLVGLLLGAVQRVRAEAFRLNSHNRLRQIGIATQNHCATNRGKLPHHIAYIRDYLEVEYDRRGGITSFQSPADPTLAAAAGFGDMSYAVNLPAFHRASGHAATSGDARDGTANTIAVGECYAKCGKAWHMWGWTGAVATCLDAAGKVVPCVNPGYRGATFADPSHDDVKPVTVNGVTLPSTPGVTFQVRPPKEACDYRQLQTPHPGGMLTAYLDGSVRTTSPGISPAAFWAAVTPAGGEVTPPE